MYSDNLSKRLSVRNDSNTNRPYGKGYEGLHNLQARLHVQGGTDQWTRMRQDKLRSLKKSLISSYQRAIVQKYDVKKDSLAKNIISIITLLQDQKELNEYSLRLLEQLEQEYYLPEDRYSTEYIEGLEQIIEDLVNIEPLFRCLINHDKLKVEYEDKIISIPFEEEPVGGDQVIETGFHNGTVFKWVHGNKEEWTPDTYWIVYMQYSEETAYFRAEIRKADEEIEIIIISQDGSEETVTYRGWMTGPGETSIAWNVKKGVIWNDMNYTKLLYITKDEDTLAFFKRFDRVKINGKPWEVQAYNDSYSVNSGSDTGIIRVALKETYTSTDQFIAAAQDEADQAQDEDTQTGARIIGPAIVKPYAIVTYAAKGFDTQLPWTLDSSLARIKSVSQDGKTATVEILTGRSSKKGFDINYGDSTIHVAIESL